LIADAIFVGKSLGCRATEKFFDEGSCCLLESEDFSPI